MRLAKIKIKTIAEVLTEAEGQPQKLEFGC